MHKPGLRITALLLLLVLTQSMGVRLMLHNKFHQRTSQQPLNPSAGNVQIACDCLDEALMPSLQAQPVELAVPEKEYAIKIAEQPFFLHSVKKIFHSLRAPPVA